jgi:hypothetical protein
MLAFFRNASHSRYDVRNDVWYQHPVWHRHGGGAGLPDSATMCFFAAFAFNPIWGSPNEITRTFLTPACGWELTPQQLADIVQRNSYLSRCVSLRGGFHPDKHASLPQRAFDEPITNKYGRTWVWSKDEWEGAKRPTMKNMKID